jgi:type IV pilus assembly protein PilM
MDELRRDRDSQDFEEDLEVELDAEVVGRLSAYGGERTGALEDAAPDGAASTDDSPAGSDTAAPSWAGEPMEPPPLSFSREEPEQSVPDPPDSAPSDDSASVLEPADGEPVAPSAEDDQVNAVDEGRVETDAAPDLSASADDVVFESTRGPAESTSRFGRRAKPKSEPADGTKRAGKSKKSKRLVGLKIGASQIAAAQVVNNGAPEVVEVYREPLAPGVVVFGEIRDADALADALKTFFAVHKLPKKGVRLGISNNRVGVRIFEVDGVEDPRQLENAVRFRAEEVLPIPLDQAVLDYVILDESVLDDGTPRKRILLVVAYREVVDRYLQACSQAGLEVVGIDHEAFALLRSLEVPEPRGPERGALVAVAMGHDRTTIAVSTGEHCEFARVLDWGGATLDIAIARELDRAPSEVQELKHQLSFAA